MKDWTSIVDVTGRMNGGRKEVRKEERKERRSTVDVTGMWTYDETRKVARRNFHHCLSDRGAGGMDGGTDG